jgi:hypothetical protein
MSAHMQINLQAYNKAIDRAFFKLVKGKWLSIGGIDILLSIAALPCQLYE